MWSVAPESMIQELFCLGLTLRKAEARLPVLTKEHEGFDWFTRKCEDWKSLCNCSNCSFVKDSPSEVPCCPWSSLVAWAEKPLESALFFFQFCGFPWIFQQFSLVCQCFLQWSHQGFFFLSLSESFLIDTRAELSVTAASGLLSSSVFIITFLLVSSLLISENASRRVGRGFFPRILDLISS